MSEESDSKNKPLNPTVIAPRTRVPSTPQLATVIAPRMRAPTNPQLPTMVAVGSIPPAISAATIGMRPRMGPDRSGPIRAPLPDVDDPDGLVGHELCGYTIQRKLAEGGMGVVYEGVHGKIGRRGAIKVLKLELCRSEEVVERFHQEARAVNAIRHENIVDVYDFGRDAHGRVYFVMEYLEGEPLAARIRRGALAWAEALPILDQTLRALKAAHDKGFVHRDLKPDNIWLKYVEGRVQVKLLDFGIAKLVGTERPREKLTQTGSVIGTPHYMSPEQINGSRSIDHRTDIYAMGVITYEMFAGITPFGGETLQAVMTGHLFKEPPRLAELPADLGVPGPIAEIVDRMLVKDAAGRYESVADVLADLHDVSRNERPARAETLNRVWPTRPPAPVPEAPHALVPVAAPSPAARPRRGRRAIQIGAGVVAVLAIVDIALWRAQRGPAPPAMPASKDLVQRSGPVKTMTPPPPADPADQPPDYEAIRRSSYALARAGLRHADYRVRELSAVLLDKLKDRDAVPGLSQRTADAEEDASVRKGTALALGAIGATATAPLLGKLERAEPAPLKVWYAAALARLGDAAARRRLLHHVQRARAKDLGTAFWAGLELAELSRPGDRKAIKLLRALAAREAELRQIVDDYAGTRILARLVALRYAPARKLLHAQLEDEHEGVRLAAAEALAKLGDGAGRQVLQEVLANPASPNRIVAAVALIPLGDYSGLPVLTEKLAAKDPEIRQLAARGLGEIGEPESIQPLQALANDADWTLRLAAAAALATIVGIDPMVLAQASVDWTKHALDSQDWAVRKAAAGVLADIPEKEAVPLLAVAIADPDEQVRLEAAKVAGKMKSPAAAVQVAAAVKGERNLAVKEQQLRALGQIGSPEVKDTLKEIADADPGRIGVIAAGSLIAVGDPSGKDRLEAAVAPAQPTELRLAAVEAAAVARSPIVVPTLRIGIVDRVFDVQLTAAEGLAALNTDQDAAVKVLNQALKWKDARVLGRAMAALARLGRQVAAGAPSPAELLDAADPRLRLAAVPIVRALPIDESVPLLRRLVLDPDQEVRRAGVDAIEEIVPKDRKQAIGLYKPLVGSADQVVRSKASGQLSRLVDPPPRPRPQPAQATQPAQAPATQPADLTAIQQTLEAAAAASTEATAAAEAFAALAQDLAARTAAPPADDAALRGVTALAQDLDAAAMKLEALAMKASAAAVAAADAAGPSPAANAAKLVAEAKAHAAGARDAASAARGKVPEAEKRARRYVKDWTRDAQMLVSTARAAMVGNDFAEAEENLARAAKLAGKASPASAAEIDLLYVELHVAQGDAAADPQARRAHLEQAREAFARLEQAGTRLQIQDAAALLAELAEEVEPGGPR